MHGLIFFLHSARGHGQLLVYIYIYIVVIENWDEQSIVNIALDLGTGPQ